MPFECDIPVRFGHVDQARIVYYPWFFHFCHEAMERMFEHVAGITYADLFGKERLGFPAVHIETDFHEKVGYGETLRMGVSIEKIGRTSVTLRFEGRRASDGVLAFRASTTTVCCDMNDFAPVPIPERYRRAFATIATPAAT
jgi:4-hydroxybenzoyl-CoA thioesterase